MAFNDIPINVTAEQIERMASRDVPEEITADSTDDELASAKATYEAILRYGGGGGGEGGGGVTSYPLLTDKPMINGVTLNGNLTPENVGAMPMFTGADEIDPDTSLKGLMFVQCSDELKSILGMPRAYIKQYFYSTGAIAENQTRAQIAIAYGDVAKMAIRQYYGTPKAWTPWVAFSGEGGTGEDGFSPVVNVTEIEGGHRVTITDVNGSQSFNIMDGFSPAISVAPINNGHEVTVTDKSGSQSFNVFHGSAFAYYMSEGETVEEAIANAEAAGKNLIIDPFSRQNTALVTENNFPDMFNALNGAVLLWSGSWTSGGITVPNLSNYNTFIVKILSGYLLCTIDGTGALNGHGGYVTSSGISYLRWIRFPISGNTITYGTHRSAYFTVSSGTASFTVESPSSAISEIYGVPTRTLEEE